MKAMTSSRLSRGGGILAIFALLAVAGTVALTTFGWMANLGWPNLDAEHDSVVTEAAGALSGIDLDKKMIRLGTTPSGRGAAAFVVTADTRLTVDNTEGALADLRDGMQVKVVYERRDDTRLAWSVEASTTQDAPIVEDGTRPNAAQPLIDPSHTIDTASLTPARSSGQSTPNGAHAQMPTPGPSLRVRPSVDGDTPRSGGGTADFHPRTRVRLGAPPARDEAGNGETSTRAQDSPHSQGRESDPSAVIDWLLTPREQAFPDVSGR